MDLEQTGGERLKGEVDVRGIDAPCLVPASRIIGMPGIIGICDGPAKGDLSFGDVTSFESENNKKIHFQETAITSNQYCN